MKSTFYLFFFSILIGLFTACSNDEKITPDKSILISPESVTINKSAQQQFTVALAGFVDQTVTWKVVEEGATISSDGVFTAPASAGSFSVQAISKEDPTIMATANVTVSDQQIPALAIFPKNVIVANNSTIEFQVDIKNSENLNVTWSIKESPNGGSIEQTKTLTNGIKRVLANYTAPNTAGVYHVVVRSGVDPTVLDEAIVTVESANTTNPYSTTEEWDKTSGIADNTIIYDLSKSGSTLMAATYKGLYISKDAGDTWTLQENAFKNKITVSITASEKIALAGSASGIFLSEDAGATWTLVKSGVYAYDFLIDGQTIYAATDGKCLKSKDGGKNWTTSSNGLPDEWFSGIVKQGASLYLSSLGKGIFKSSDNGDSWVAVNNGIKDEINHLTNWGIESDGTYLYAANRLGGVYRSANEGSSWISASAGLPAGSEIRNIKAMQGVVYLTTGKSGVYASVNNGASWFDLNNNLALNNVYDGLLILDNYILVGGGTVQNIYKRKL